MVHPVRRIATGADRCHYFWPRRPRTYLAVEAVAFTSFSSFCWPAGPALPRGPLPLRRPARPANRRASRRAHFADPAPGAISQEYMLELGKRLRSSSKVFEASTRSCCTSQRSCVTSRCAPGPAATSRAAHWRPLDACSLGKKIWCDLMRRRTAVQGVNRMLMAWHGPRTCSFGRKRWPDQPRHRAGTLAFEIRPMPCSLAPAISCSRQKNPNSKHAPVPTLVC